MQSTNPLQRFAEQQANQTQCPVCSTFYDKSLESCLSCEDGASVNNSQNAQPTATQSFSLGGTTASNSNGGPNAFSFNTDTDAPNQPFSFNVSNDAPTTFNFGTSQISSSRQNFASPSQGRMSSLIIDSDSFGALSLKEKAGKMDTENGNALDASANHLQRLAEQQANQTQCAVCSSIYDKALGSCRACEDGTKKDNSSNARPNQSTAQPFSFGGPSAQPFSFGQSSSRGVTTTPFPSATNKNSTAFSFNTNTGFPRNGKAESMDTENANIDPFKMDEGKDFDDVNDDDLLAEVTYKRKGSIIDEIGRLGPRQKSVVLVFGTCEGGSEHTGFGEFVNYIPLPSVLPVSKRSDVNFTQVVIGNSTTFAIDDQRRIWAWGDGDEGLMADGTKDDQYEPRLVPDQNFVKEGGGAKQITTGASHTLVLLNNGHVYSWGCYIKNRTSGEKERIHHTIKNGDKVKRQLTPRQVLFKQGTPKINKIASGADFSVALDENGDVHAWGPEGYKHVNYESLENKRLEKYTREAQHVPAWGGKNICFVDICAGKGAFYAVSRDRQLYSYGRDSYGALARKMKGYTNEIKTAGFALQPVKECNDVIPQHGVAALEYHAWVRRKSPAGNILLSCWGNNTEGELGYFVKLKQEQASVVCDLRLAPEVYQSLNVKRVWCGQRVTFFLTERGDLMCVGSHLEYRLGLSSEETKRKIKKEDEMKKEMKKEAGDGESKIEEQPILPIEPYMCISQAELGSEWKVDDVSTDNSLTAVVLVKAKKGQKRKEVNKSPNLRSGKRARG